MIDNRTESVKKVSAINFSGNIIPNSWFQVIKLPGGRPDTTAILILAEIIYWYRDYEVKDEDSGETLGYKKKFRSDMLQRSYESFSTQFGFKKSSVQSAFKNLRSLGLVRTELRTINISGGLRCNNVLFVEPIPKAVLSITVTMGPPPEKLGEAPQEKLGEVPKKSLGTNTESTTESTTEKKIDRSSAEKPQKLFEYSKPFLEFWKAYPRKTAKGLAFQAFKKAEINGKLSEVLAAIDMYKKTKQWQDVEFIPHPSTWLNQRRWEDEPLVNRKQAEPPRIPRNPLEYSPAEKALYDKFEKMQNSKRPEA